MTTLYLVRHGETVDNVNQVMQGQTQGMLNEKGSAYLIEQTKQFKEWILRKFSPEMKPSNLSGDTRN